MDLELRHKIALYVLRSIFFAASIGVSLYVAEVFHAIERGMDPLLFVLYGGGVALFVIFIEVFFSRSSIRTISSIVFGLLIGFIAAYLFTAIVRLMVENAEEQRRFLSVLQLVSTLIFCYFGISLLLQTQNDFRFIIPYVEFRRDLKGPLPLILDTSVLIDGRILKLVQLDLFDAPLVVPIFVVEELQRLADSSDRWKRQRGRRGLDHLEELKKMGKFLFEFSHKDFPEEDNVDHKLLRLAEHIQGKLVTCDHNLAKVAAIYNVRNLNLHDLAQALKIHVLPGDEIRLKLIRQGESPKQGIGYLPDGTLVVVDKGASHIGEEVTAVVRNIHQTSSGKMVFAILQKPVS